jgi:putative ABC transport system ATP-binding protein
MLNIIGTLSRASSGTVRLDGYDVDDLNDRELSALRGGTIGFVFQQFHLAGNIPALDNVADGLLYSGRSRSERLRLAERALHRIGDDARQRVGRTARRKADYHRHRM